MPIPNMPNYKVNKEGGKKPVESDLTPLKISVTSDDYYFHPKLIEDFEDLKATVLGIENFGNEMGARNYLLSGPPGTGKTLAAQVLSAELGMPFYDIGGLVKGQSNAVGQVFEELRKLAVQSDKGVIAFIDEVEGLSNRGDVVDPMQYQSLTQMLSEMDGVHNNKGVFIIGTTNRPNDLDEAMRSRFSEEIEFLPPDKNGRYEILKKHAHGRGGHNFKVGDKDLEQLADVSFGYVGRDLKQILNRAFTHAIRDKRIEVKYEDLEYGLKKTKPSAIRDMPFIEPKVKLENIAGYKDHTGLIKSVFDRSNESVLLFYGPKGTGKTMCAEAFAGEYGYNFILLKGSELESKWVGESKDRVEKVINRAKQLSPCILCFDEISSFVEQKGVLSHKGSQTGYLQSVLSRPPEGVYIIATDNNPNFLRGPFMDRFIHKLYFGMPTKDEQVSLWEMYAPTLDSNELVDVNDNLSCRDIAYACKRADDYGLKPSVEVFKRLLGSMPKNQDNYDHVVKEIGDGVQDYNALKDLREVKE